MVKIGFNLIGVNADTFNVVLGVAILVAMTLNASLILLRNRVGARSLS
jgi:simple sugar transport system permease protein